MRGNPNTRIRRNTANLRLTILQKPQIPIDVIGKPQLAPGKRFLVHPAIAVENRQMGQANTGLPGRRIDPRAELAQTRIGFPAGLVMDIVKLADSGVSGLLHLHEDLRRDGLHVLWRQLIEKPVHEIPPGPETFPTCRPELGHPGHGALEGMAVEVRQGREQRIDPAIVGLRRNTDFNRRNLAVSDLDTNVLRPFCAEKGRPGV